MKIIMVPYGDIGPTDNERRFADLILEEEESGNFRATKYRHGPCAEVEVRVWDDWQEYRDHDPETIEKINSIYRALGVDDGDE